MELYENYYLTGRGISTKAGQDEFYGALIRYLFEGVVPDKFRNSEAKVAFQGVEPSRKKQWAGRRNNLGIDSKGKEQGNEGEGGQVSGKQAGGKREAKGKQAAKETTSNVEASGRQTGGNAEANGTKRISYKENKLSSIDTPLKPPRENQDFPLRCLDALNRALGRTYSTMPTACWDTLQRFEDAYDVADVKAMVEFKRDEWRGTKFAAALNPNTLFSPNHFDQYMGQYQQAKEVDESYDDYDRD